MVDVSVLYGCVGRLIASFSFSMLLCVASVEVGFILTPGQHRFLPRFGSMRGGKRERSRLRRSAAHISNVTYI